MHRVVLAAAVEAYFVYVLPAKAAKAEFRKLSWAAFPDRGLREPRIMTSFHVARTGRAPGSLA